jgi:catechol 2,3-dioxygenase-like lactoylglutathione lyase family enzyme
MTSAIPIKGGGPSLRLTPLKLHHAAWVTHDVEETAHFYVNIMGMEIASTVMEDEVPSTGDKFPYFHVFFRMADGSTLAFFEAPGLPERSSVAHPAYEIFDHIALEVKDTSEVERWRDWLVQNGIQVIGPTDHGIIYSIYFRDPNALRLEITTSIDPNWNRYGEIASADLKIWCDTKQQAQGKGEDVKGALLGLIRARRSEK